MKKKTGFLGGTFDPPHFGHLNLLVEVKERCHLDQILVCPAHESPSKTHRPTFASAEHRFNMVKLMIEELDHVLVIDHEVKRPPPSFTIETIQTLHGQHPHLFLIMAEDTAYTLGKWKESEKLLELCSPLIGTRHGFQSSALEEVPAFVKEKLEKGQVDIPAMDISSTALRERLKKNLYVGHLIPSKVLDYITQHRLY